jgi:hypothetical protein
MVIKQIVLRIFCLRNEREKETVLNVAVSNSRVARIGTAYMQALHGFSAVTRLEALLRGDLLVMKC